MPIYDYYCQACGKQSEVMHKISDPPATICPVCGKPALIKQMSATGFRLKGAGWYETDFKSGHKKNLADDGSASKPASSEPAAVAKPTPTTSSTSSGAAT